MADTENPAISIVTANIIIMIASTIAVGCHTWAGLSKRRNCQDMMRTAPPQPRRSARAASGSPTRGAAKFGVVSSVEATRRNLGEAVPGSPPSDDGSLGSEPEEPDHGGILVTRDIEIGIEIHDADYDEYNEQRHLYRDEGRGDDHDYDGEEEGEEDSDVEEAGIAHAAGLPVRMGFTALAPQV